MAGHEATNPLNKMIGGDHYRKGGIQPVEFLESNPQMTFCQQQIIKYASRLGLKGGEEGLKKDIEKIKHYCDLFMELRK